MYAGRIVEEGPPQAVLHNPAHPYTRALLAAIPQGIKSRKQHVRCRRLQPILQFRPRVATSRRRCPVALPLCTTSSPEMVALSRDHRPSAIGSNHRLRSICRRPQSESVAPGLDRDRSRSVGKQCAAVSFRDRRSLPHVRGRQGGRLWPRRCRRRPGPRCPLEPMRSHSAILTMYRSCVPRASRAHPALCL